MFSGSAYPACFRVNSEGKRRCAHIFNLPLVLSVSSISKRWNASNEPSTAQKVKEAVRPGGPLKPKLEAAVGRIDIQSRTLDRSLDSFGQRYHKLFNELVKCYERHDTVKARILANELAEIQKMQKMTLQANFALEQISMRLHTLTDLGDVATSLAPIVGIVRNMKSTIGGISSSASNGLSEIGDLLSNISMEAGAVSGITINFNSETEDSQKILSEAAALAEQRMKTKFPDLQQIEQQTGQKTTP